MNGFSYQYFSHLEQTLETGRREFMTFRPYRQAHNLKVLYINSKISIQRMAVFLEQTSKKMFGMKTFGIQKFALKKSYKPVKLGSGHTCLTVSELFKYIYREDTFPYKKGGKRNSPMFLLSMTLFSHTGKTFCREKTPLPQFFYC